MSFTILTALKKLAGRTKPRLLLNLVYRHAHIRLNLRTLFPHIVVFLLDKAIAHDAQRLPASSSSVEHTRYAKKWHGSFNRI